MRLFYTIYFFVFSQFIFAQNSLFKENQALYTYHKYANERFIFLDYEKGWIKFDGRINKKYLNDDKTSGLKGTWVQSDLIKDNSNELWSCTYEYLCKYNEKAGFNCFQPVFKGDTINTEIKVIHFFKEKSELLFRFKEKLLLYNTINESISEFDILSSNGQVFFSYKENGNLNFATSPWTSNPEMEIWAVEADKWQKKKFDFSTCFYDVGNILISDFYCYGDELWLLSSKGLVKLDEKDHCKSKLFQFDNKKINCNKLEFFKDHLIISTDFNGLLIFDLLSEEFLTPINTLHPTIKLNSNSPFEIFDFENKFILSFTDGTQIQTINKSRFEAELLFTNRDLENRSVNLIKSNDDYFVLSDRETYLAIYSENFQLVNEIKLDGSTVVGEFELNDIELKFTDDSRLFKVPFDGFNKKLVYENQSSKINYLFSQGESTYLTCVNNLIGVVNSDTFLISKDKVLSSVARFIKIDETIITSNTTELKVSNSIKSETLQFENYISLLEVGRGKNGALILTSSQLSILNIKTHEIEKLEFDNISFNNVLVKNDKELISWGKDGAYLIDENNKIRKIIHGKEIKSLAFFNEYYIFSSGKNEMHAVHESEIIQPGFDSLQIYNSTYPYELKRNSYNITYKYFEEPLTLDFTASSVVANENNYYSISYEDKNLAKEFLTFQEAKTFNRFSQGKNKFIVQGYNQDGSLSNKLNFIVNVRGPVYQQWWFYTILAGLLIGGLVLYYRTREKRLKDKFALTEEINNLKKVGSSSTNESSFYI